MKGVVSIVCSLIAGLVGGYFGSRVGRPVERRLEDVVRARRFELVDEKGAALSLWGTDKKAGQALLVFGGYWPEGAPYKTGIHPELSLEDQNSQRAAFGVMNDYPYLFYRALDGKPRMRLYLNMYDKPTLLMDDERETRLHLGVVQSDTPSTEDNNWVLDFSPNRAIIGSYVVRDGGIRYIKGMLGVSKEKIEYPHDPAH